MTEILNQKINEEIARLPKEKQEAINSIDWGLLVKQIGNRFGLIEEEIEGLQTETGLVLTGYTNIEDLSTNIEEQVGLKISDSEKIAIEIYLNVFEPIINKSEPSIIDKTFISDPRFSKIPIETQKAISSFDWETKIREIVKKYKLSIDKIDPLEKTTIKVMAGEIETNNYEYEVKSVLNLSTEDSHNLVENINNEILKPIREILKKNSEIKEDNNEDEIPLPPYQLKVEAPIIKKEIKIENKPVEEKIPELMPLEIKESTPFLELPQTKEVIQPITISSGVNILKDKLLNETTSNNTVSDYSLPKIGNSNQAPSVARSNSHDPYHEEI